MVRKSHIIFFIIFWNSPSFCQIVSGKFIDRDSKNSIGYCTIGVLGKNIGSVSDRDGNFILDISNVEDADTLVISTLGYESILIDGFSLKSNKTHIYELSEKSYLLKEIEIIDNPENILLGDFNTKKFKGFNGWGGLENAGKGKSVGLLFDIDKEILLDKLLIHFDKNSYDSSLLRLHLYSLDEEFAPKDEILSKDILFTVYQASGWYELDISKYSIDLKQDFAASIEWVNSWGVRDKSGMLTISRAPNIPGISIYRASPQGNWSRQEGASAPTIQFKGIVIDSLSKNTIVKQSDAIEMNNVDAASFDKVLPQINNDGVVVESDKPNPQLIGKKKMKIGVVNTSRSTDGGSGFLHEPTSEVGSLIKGSTDFYKLEKFNFHLKYNSFDSILFELNIYQFDNNRRIVKTLSQGIKFKIGRSIGWQELSISSYEIYLKGDFIVTLKAVKGLSLNKKPKDLYFTLGAGTGYVKEINTNDWTKRDGTCRAFNLIVSN